MDKTKMVCPNYDECELEEKGWTAHCLPHDRIESCGCGAFDCPKCVPVKAEVK